MHKNAAYRFFIGIRLGYRAVPLGFRLLDLIFLPDLHPVYRVVESNQRLVKIKMTHKLEYVSATEKVLQRVGGLAENGIV